MADKLTIDEVRARWTKASFLPAAHIAKQDVGFLLSEIKSAEKRIEGMQKALGLIIARIDAGVSYSMSHNIRECARAALSESGGE